MSQNIIIITAILCQKWDKITWPFSNNESFDVLNSKAQMNVHLSSINPIQNLSCRELLRRPFSGVKTTCSLNDYTFELASTQFIFISAIFHAQRATHTQMQAINKLQKHTFTFDLYVTAYDVCVCTSSTAICVGVWRSVRGWGAPRRGARGLTSRVAPGAQRLHASTGSHWFVARCTRTQCIDLIYPFVYTNILFYHTITDANTWTLCFIVNKHFHNRFSIWSWLTRDWVVPRTRNLCVRTL